jgi:hypothetical protein
MAVVVDTNVAMVASRLAPQADDQCIDACIRRLTEIKSHGGLLVDDLGLILYEYTKKLGYSGQPGAGHAFAKWAHDHQAMPTMVLKIPITPNAGGDHRKFEEFPTDSKLSTFDKSDQKFVAVALASRKGPPILNAVDSDWWKHKSALKAAGVTLEFLCPPHTPTPRAQ